MRTTTDAGAAIVEEAAAEKKATTATTTSLDVAGGAAEAARRYEKEADEAARRVVSEAKKEAAEWAEEARERGHKGSETASLPSFGTAHVVTAAPTPARVANNTNTTETTTATTAGANATHIKSLVGGVVGGTLGVVGAGLLGGLIHSALVSTSTTTLGSTTTVETTSTLTTTVTARLAVLADLASGSAQGSILGGEGFLANASRMLLPAAGDAVAGPKSAADALASEFWGLGHQGQMIAVAVLLGGVLVGLLIGSVAVKQRERRARGMPLDILPQEGDGSPAASAEPSELDEEAAEAAALALVDDVEAGGEEVELFGLAGGVRPPPIPHEGLRPAFIPQLPQSAPPVPLPPLNSMQPGFATSMPTLGGMFSRASAPTAPLFSPLPPQSQAQPLLRPVAFSPRGGHPALSGKAGHNKIPTYLQFP